MMKGIWLILFCYDVILITVTSQTTPESDKSTQAGGQTFQGKSNDQLLEIIATMQRNISNNHASMITMHNLIYHFENQNKQLKSEHKKLEDANHVLIFEIEKLKNENSALKLKNNQYINKTNQELSTFDQNKKYFEKLTAALKENYDATVGKIESIQEGMKHLVIPQGRKCVKNEVVIDTVDGRNYYFSKFKTDWSSARKFCADNEMDLASIETEEENFAVGQHLTSTYGTSYSWYYWTSGTDEDSEGDWIWAATNKSIDYKNSFIISDNRNMNCLAIRDPSSSFKWIDRSCSLHFHFICELQSPCE